MLDQLLMQDSETSSYVIDPDTCISKVWNSAVLLVLVFNAVVVPFQVAFAPPAKARRAARTVANERAARRATCPSRARSG